jgi:hypothetical protein
MWNFKIQHKVSSLFLAKSFGLWPQCFPSGKWNAEEKFCECPPPSLVTPCFYDTTGLFCFTHSTSFLPFYAFTPTTLSKGLPYTGISEMAFSCTWSKSKIDSVFYKKQNKNTESPPQRLKPWNIRCSINTFWQEIGFLPNLCKNLGRS